MVNLVNAGLQGIVAFSEVGSQRIARYAARLVCQVEFKILHAFFNRRSTVILPVVPVDFFHGNFFFRNEASPFHFRLVTPKRRVVRIFFGKDFLAAFLIVARIWIGGGSNHFLTPARVTIRTFTPIAFEFHLLRIGAFSTSDGTLVIFLVERVELVIDPFPLPVDAPVHDGVVVDVVVALQFAIQAFTANSFVGTARIVATYGNCLLDFAGDALVDGSLSFFIVGAGVFVVRANAASVVTRVAGIFPAAFGHLLALFAASDGRLEALVFGAGLHVVNAFAAVHALFVTRYRGARAVHEDVFHAFLDDADSHGAVGAGALEAVVAFAFVGRDIVRAFLTHGIAYGTDVANFFAEIQTPYSSLPPDAVQSSANFLRSSSEAEDELRPLVLELLEDLMESFEALSADTLVQEPSEQRYSSSSAIV